MNNNYLLKNPVSSHRLTLV